MRVASGSVDVYMAFPAVDATDLVTPETGLTGFTVYRSRNGAAAVAWTTPTVVELDATNMPGMYALLLDEGTTIDAAHDEEELTVYITHASMDRVVRAVELFRPKVTVGSTITVSGAGAEAGKVTQTAASIAAVADAVWDEVRSGHVTDGTYGAAVRHLISLREFSRIIFTATTSRGQPTAGYILLYDSKAAYDADVDPWTGAYARIDFVAPHLGAIPQSYGATRTT